MGTLVVQAGAGALVVESQDEAAVLALCSVALDRGDVDGQRVGCLGDSALDEAHPAQVGPVIDLVQHEGVGGNGCLAGFTAPASGTEDDLAAAGELGDAGRASARSTARGRDGAALGFQHRPDLGGPRILGRVHGRVRDQHGLAEGVGPAQDRDEAGQRSAVLHRLDDGDGTVSGVDGFQEDPLRLVKRRVVGRALAFAVSDDDRPGVFDDAEGAALERGNAGVDDHREAIACSMAMDSALAQRSRSAGIRSAGR